MRVVIDSNLLIADYHQSSPSFQLLSRAAERCGVVLQIPEIVVDEVVNKHREECAKAWDKKAALDREAKRLFGPASGCSFTGEIRETFPDRLSTRLQEAGVRILPYPKTEHKKLARHAMQKRKPFQGENKGYRDALIWETVP